MRHLLLPFLCCIAVSSCSVKKAKKPQPRKIATDSHCVDNPDSVACQDQEVDESACLENPEGEACAMALVEACENDPSQIFCDLDEEEALVEEKTIDEEASVGIKVTILGEENEEASGDESAVEEGYLPLGEDESFLKSR